MRQVSLNGTWNLRYGPQHENGPNSPKDLSRIDWPTIPATVPGNVELDLIKGGEINDDIEVGSRIYGLRKYETYEWWYHRTFSSPRIEKGQRIELVFEGLDCLGTVWLNGLHLGDTDNMFIAHRFDVTDHLLKGRENELFVRIESAVLEGRRYEVEPLQISKSCRYESLNVRKAPHMYGWDIMPRVISAGLWRDVHLEIINPTHWRSVYWTTLEVDASERTATIMVDWDLVTERHDIDPLSVRLILRHEGKEVFRSQYPVISTHDRKQITLQDVDLWWPRGYGEPAMYEASLELLDQDKNILDTYSCHIGVRTVELIRTEVTSHEKPGEFVFIVNGEKIFARGTNWVPLDAFHSRDAQHLNDAIEMAVDLNCTMIRCWGGNVYEDHAFFDLCDTHGIMVWQDFAFACNIYPQNESFAERIRAEAKAVIKKLRNHASLVLWSGNNEVDQVYRKRGIGIDPNTERISREVLPHVVLRIDPKRTYLPSSPYYSPEAVRHGNEVDVMPEVHLWGKRPYYKDAFYIGKPAHFVSEIGYHGCPERKTLEQFLDPDHLWPWQDNDQWQTKATRPHPEDTGYVYRISLMARQILNLFENVPEDLDTFILASQIVQAEAKKFFVEWWRQGKWKRTGILWWNLRDGWPIFSDAIVDYYNRKKLAYWYLKRVQTNVCVICGEPDKKDRLPLIAVNDTLRQIKGSAIVRNVDDNEILSESNFTVEPNGKTIIDYLPHSDQHAMWLIEWRIGESVYYNHYLVGTPSFNLDEYQEWLTKISLPEEAYTRLLQVKK